MLITDHDTYKGYRHWKYNMKGKVHEDFVVLKGIEYDTCDAGHILCIMPEGVKMRLLELKGMSVQMLIDFCSQARRDPGAGPSVRREIFKFYKHEEVFQFPGDDQAVRLYRSFQLLRVGGVQRPCQETGAESTGSRASAGAIPTRSSAWDRGIPSCPSMSPARRN